MPSVRKINKQLNKTFEGRVEAYEEDGYLVLTGQLGRWNEVVTAGMIAAAEKLDLKILNDIECTGEKPLKVRKPHIEDSHLEWEEPDVLIIGGGVIGCAVARELSRYNLNILLVEKEHDVAMQATGHCMGMVHSGIKLQNGTLKSWYTRQGSQKLENICTELSVPFKRSGQYLLYTNPLWSPFMIFSMLYWRWRGLKGARVVRGDELRNLEPGARSGVSALFLPSGGVVCPQTLTIAYAENSVQNGVRISFNTMVQEMKVEDGVIKSVTTNRGTVHPKVVVNAAGLFCEDIAAMAGDRFYSVHPVKGTTVVIDRKHADSLAVTSVSTLARTSREKKRSPEDLFRVVRTVHGSVLAGPFCMETINKEDFSTDRYSIGKVIEQAKHITPALEGKQVLKAFSGICAASYDGDFIVSKGRAVTNLIHAAGIQFPGLTASPAIAEDVVAMVCEMLGRTGSLKTNPEFQPARIGSPVLRDMEAGARESLIEADPNYGIIICHCEHVSKGEILEALRRDVKCDSIDGVKRRVRTGCGHCQGQYCTHCVLEIISSEKMLAPQYIRKSGRGSEVVFGNAAAIADRKNSAMFGSKDEHESDAVLKYKLNELAVSELHTSSGNRSDE